MIVPSVSSKLVIDICRGCDINASLSAYSFNKGPISCLDTFVSFLENWQEIEIVLSDVLELWYRTVHYRTMRLISSCPITGPDAIEAFVGKILSSVVLLIHQSSGISTFHIPTFRQQSIFPFDYCFRTSSFSLCLVPRWRFLQLEQVVPFHTDSSDKNNHCFKHFVAVSTEPINIEIINSFSGAPVV